MRDHHGQSGDWEYRIVLEQPNGEPLPLVPQGADLAGAKQRLQDILNDPDTTYPKGWIERRGPNAWQAFSAAQRPGEAT